MRTALLVASTRDGAGNGNSIGPLAEALLSIHPDYAAADFLSVTDQGTLGEDATVSGAKALPYDYTYGAYHYSDVSDENNVVCQVATDFSTFTDWTLAVKILPLGNFRPSGDRIIAQAQNTNQSMTLHSDGDITVKLQTDSGERSRRSTNPLPNVTTPLWVRYVYTGGDGLLQIQYQAAGLSNTMPTSGWTDIETDYDTTSSGGAVSFTEMQFGHGTFNWYQGRLYAAHFEADGSTVCAMGIEEHAEVDGTFIGSEGETWVVNFASSSGLPSTIVNRGVIRGGGAALASMADNAGYDFDVTADSFTMVTWIRYETGTNDHISGKTGSHGGGPGYSFHTLTGNTPRAEINDGTNSIQLIGSAMSTQTDYLLVMTVEAAGNVNLWQNGVKVAGPTSVGSVADLSNAVTMRTHQHGGGGNVFPGAVMYHGVFDRVLTDDEIGELETSITNLGAASV